MILSKKVLAVITARAGSKGLKNKNVALLAGKPLVVYTIDAAKSCKYIDSIVVTTDGIEIERVSLQRGTDVVRRPVELSGDMSLSEDVLLHAVNCMEKDGDVFEITILLQPTSPFRTGRHITEALEKFVENDADCLIGLTRTEHSPYKYFIKNNNSFLPFMGEDSLFLPRQKLPETYRGNGALYIVKTDFFKTHKSFYAPGFVGYEMSPEESIDIDTEHDLKYAEYVMQRRSYED